MDVCSDCGVCLSFLWFILDTLPLSDSRTFSRNSSRSLASSLFPQFLLFKYSLTSFSWTTSYHNLIRTLLYLLVLFECYFLVHLPCVKQNFIKRPPVHHWELNSSAWQHPFLFVRAHFYVIIPTMEIIANYHRSWSRSVLLQRLCLLKGQNLAFWLEDTERLNPREDTFSDVQHHKRFPTNLHIPANSQNHLSKLHEARLGRNPALLDDSMNDVLFERGWEQYEWLKYRMWLGRWSGSVRKHFALRGTFGIWNRSHNPMAISWERRYFFDQVPPITCFIVLLSL